MSLHPVLETCLRKDRLSDAEWAALIEARLADVKGLIASRSSTLGKVECLRRGTFQHMIQADLPDIADKINRKVVGTNIEGIFGVQDRRHVRNISNTGYTAPSGMAFPNGTIKVWGLTSEGDWLLATVHFVGESRNGEEGYERAGLVEIDPATAEEVLTKGLIDPQDILEKLANLATFHLATAQSVQSSAANLVERINFEDRLLGAMAIR